MADHDLGPRLPGAATLTDDRLAEWAAGRPANPVTSDGVLMALELQRLRRARPLPDRKTWDASAHNSGDDHESADYVDGWNDALDAVARLAGMP